MGKKTSAAGTQKTYVGKKELWMFSIGGLGQGMIYALMSSFISDYYLSVLYLSPMFVLMLMLLARIWDAINDPLMGIIADRHVTKWGKFKPYIIFAAGPIALFSILMYLSPSLDKGALMIYSAIVYVAWGMIYTMADVPFWSIPNVITPNPDERSHVVSFAKIWNSIGSALPKVVFFSLSAIVPKILDGADINKTNQTIYLLLAIIVVAIGTVLYVNSYFHIKERNIPKPTKKKANDGSTLSRIFHCKPLILVIIMGVLSSGRYMVQAASLHVARYSFFSMGNNIATSVGLVDTVLQVCAAVGMFGSTLLMPKLMQKFDYKKLLITTCLAGFVASIATAIIGTATKNLKICIPLIIIQCIPLGVINTLSIAMIYDCLDYMELKTGHRDNALGSACQGFVNKLGSALSTAGIVVMYMLLNIKPETIYSKNVDVAKVAGMLSQNQKFAMFALVSVIPGISMLLCSIPMFFYKLSGENKKKMQQELAAQREARGFMVND